MQQMIRFVLLYFNRKCSFVDIPGLFILFTATYIVSHPVNCIFQHRTSIEIRIALHVARYSPNLNIKIFETSNVIYFQLYKSSGYTVAVPVFSFHT